MEKLENEIWKDVPYYEGLYQVSNFGNVKSLSYRRTGLEKILKPCLNKDGYYRVTLHQNNKMKISFAIYIFSCFLFVSVITGCGEKEADNKSSQEKSDYKIQQMKKSNGHTGI